MKKTDIKVLGKRYERSTSKILSRQNIPAKFKQPTRGARYLGLGYRLGDSTQSDKALKLTESLALKTGVLSVVALRRQGLIWYQYSLPKELSTTYKMSDIEPGFVGIGDGREQIEFLPPEAYTQAAANPHSAFIGEPGSGKTTLIKATLLSLMRYRSPQDLQLVICDTKTDLKPFENSVYLNRPIATTQATQSESINAVATEVKHRMENNIKDPSQLTILAIDEPALLTGKDYNSLTFIASQGRGLYVWLIMGAQNPTQAKFKQLYSYLSNRFGGKVAQGESYRAMKMAQLNADGLLGTGDFIKADKFNPRRFQAPNVIEGDFKLLERKEIVQPPPVQVIEDVEILQPEPSAMGRPTKFSLDLDILATYCSYGLRGKELPVACADYLFKFSRNGDKYYQHKKYRVATARFVRIIHASNKRLLCKGVM